MSRARVQGWDASPSGIQTYKEESDSHDYCSAHWTTDARIQSELETQQKKYNSLIITWRKRWARQHFRAKPKAKTSEDVASEKIIIPYFFDFRINGPRGEKRKIESCDGRSSCVISMPFTRISGRKCSKVQQQLRFARRQWFSLAKL